MRSVTNIGDIKGKTILVHLDLNVEILNGAVVDDFRIKKSMPLVKFLRDRGANLIFLSHIDPDPETSLRPVFEYLGRDLPVVFVEDYFPQKPDFSSYFMNGKIVVLENVRKYKEEKENNKEFARHLASFADFFVNEAFSVSHRNHASIVGVPNYVPSFAGFVFEDEIRNLSKVFQSEHPFVFVLGGAKFETKLPLIEKFWNVADTVFVGGALANDFLKEKGLPVGKSLLSPQKFDLKPFLTEKLILPTDVVVTTSEGRENKFVEDVLPKDTIVDVGPETITEVASKMVGARFVLWNGPLGNYENGFKEGTESLARIIAGNVAHSIVGGGDTVASIAELGLYDKFSFISTGGGAMLDFLANETLPGIEALK